LEHPLEKSSSSRGEAEYRCAPLQAAALGRSWVLVRPLGGGSARLLRREVAELLLNVRTFAPLYRHGREQFRSWYQRQRERYGSLRTVMAALRQGLATVPRIRAIGRAEEFNPWLAQECLQALAREGLLVSREEVLSRLRAGAHVGARSLSAITTVAIPSANRPRELLRCVDSYAAAIVRHGRRARLLICDSSPGSAAADSRRAVSARVAPLGLRLDYVTMLDKAAFVERLAAEAGVAAVDAGFALLDGAMGSVPSAGANRNAILLATLGEGVLSVDDDTLCIPARVKGRERGYRFDSRFDPRRVRLFGERESAIADGAAEDVDVLALHERLLGRSLAVAVSDGDAVVDFSHADDAVFDDVWHHRGRVLATSTGLRGRSGLQWPFRYLDPEPGWRREVQASSQPYRALVESQAMLAAVERFTLSNGSFLSSMFFAVDGTALLPPFMPVFRSQDVLFGDTLRACYEDAYMGHLPWTLVHDPGTDRRVSLEQLARHTGLETAQFIGMFVRRASLSLLKEPLDRLTMLGRFIRDLGQLEHGEFVALMQDVYYELQTARIVRFERHLSESDELPDDWVRHVRLHIAELHAAMSNPASVVPSDVLVFGDEAWVHAQTLVRRFGRLLELWPSLVGAARRLADRERGLVPAP
jgi:hypothetical protein